MARRWADPSAFRADPSVASTQRPSHRQAAALFAVLALAASAVTAASYLIRPDRARAFDLLHGSVFLGDQTGPVAVDLATAKPTFRLLGAEKLVSVRTPNDMSLVPLDGGTLLLNKTTGEFNLVDNTGFAVKHDGSGVQFGKPPANPSAAGFASGQFAYVERTAAGTTDVYLVSKVTVEAAVNSPRSVKARAAIRIKDTGTTDPGGAAAANGDLWLLLGSGARQRIEQLSVPTNSKPGAVLAETAQGTVNGIAAIGTGTLGRDGSGATAVGVASSDRIQLFAPGAAARTVRFTAQQGVDSILPASNGQGRISFLIHSSAGWSVVSIGADGTGLRGPTRLDRVASDAKLVAPAASGGSLFTMQRANGQILRIGPDNKTAEVPGAASYPIVQSVETAATPDAYVIATESRVLFDSPTHSNAIAVFTDGSRGPTVIKKSNATTVSAAGGAEALTKGRIAAPNTPRGKPPPAGSKPPVTAQPINNKIDCTSVTQKPHIPTITGAVPGSRTVTLEWHYPTISPQDCVPSTYVISVKLLSNDAPSAPSSVTVESQTGTTLGGLYPSTQYEITLTAYIHGQGTSSPPIRVTTGPEGPAAPTNLRVVADAAGNWVVSWESCGVVRQGCVEARSWRVIPSICDGLGVSSPPTPVDEDADPTTRQQPAVTYRGGDALLGRGLQFQVEGTGVTGAVGNTSAKSPCTNSWTRPDASGLTLVASHPPLTALGGTASTDVTLNLGDNPVHAVGGVGAKITFTLSGPNGTQTKGPFTYSGSGSTIVTSFDGVRAGAIYQANVTVSAPGHPGASAALGPVVVSTSARWPDMTLHASCPPVGLIRLTCNLTVSVSGLSSADAQNERFNIIDTAAANSQLRCGGGPAASLDRSGIDPAVPITLNNLSLLLFSGNCTVTLVLQESQPGVFGGSISPILQVSFDGSPPTTYNANQSDFTADWDNNPNASQATVRYVGTQFSETQLAELTQNWRETITAPNGTQCGTGSSQPTGAGIEVQADNNCVRQYGSQSGWKLTISYDDQGGATTHTLSPYALTGPPPGFQACSPLGFQASWGATLSDGVMVTYSGTPASVAGCSNFRYTLQNASGQSCGTPDQQPAPPAPSTILVDGGTDCTPADGWTVAIAWHNDDTGGNDGVNPDIPLGTPPPS